MRVLFPPPYDDEHLAPEDLHVHVSEDFQPVVAPAETLDRHEHSASLRHMGTVGLTCMKIRETRASAIITRKMLVTTAEVVALPTSAAPPRTFMPM